MSIREDIEAVEQKILSPKACLSRDSKGRVAARSSARLPARVPAGPGPDHPFQAFRRLKHKTQVFLAPTGDHYRTRLTHTLEVSQIARTIARALFLNEDLTEAIALGHDLGHTPFGHAGEEPWIRSSRRFLVHSPAEPAGGGSSGQRGQGPEPDLGGPGRHRKTPKGKAAILSREKRRTA